MAKGKSFAEKMLKSNKPKSDYDCVKVVEAKTTDKGSVRYETRIVKIAKGESEKKVLGL